MNDPVGYARAKQARGAAMVLMPKDEQVHIEIPGALQDHACDVVLRRTDHPSVRVDARVGQLIDQILSTPTSA